MRLDDLRRARNLSQEQLAEEFGVDQAVIVRNSGIAAGIVSPEQAELLPMLEAVLHEMGESLAMAADPVIVAAVRAAEEEAARGHTVSYNV
ncbi:MAG TPA: helix-turn-helix transcriptional regulator [Candidatus Baltobacteraceae bacterium]|jgi:predicted transcriptional regulator|nr:helix-turn-helix transcriptional regulator [Candidatus Baltobacteraceae bacterium]